MPKTEVMKRPDALPYADTKIAIYLSRQIEALASQKSQREIAVEAGYKPNMLSMMKRGESRVPLDGIPALASALHVDPAHLFRLAMETYWPEMNDIVTSVFGRVVSANAIAIYEEIAKHTDEHDPHLSPELKRAIREAMKAAPKSAR